MYGSVSPQFIVTGMSGGLKIGGGGGMLMEGHKMPSVVEIGLTDLPKSGGRSAHP